MECQSAKCRIFLGFTQIFLCTVAQLSSVYSDSYTSGIYNSNGSSKYNDDGSKKMDIDYITRKGIFQHLWINGELSREHRDYLWKQMPVISKGSRAVDDGADVKMTASFCSYK